MSTVVWAITWTNKAQTVGLDCVFASLVVGWFDTDATSKRMTTPPGVSMHSLAGDRDYRLRMLRRRALLPRGASGRALTEISVPLWPLIAAGGIGAWICRPRRVRPGHCRVCGYDLRGGTSERCPECGSAVSGRLGDGYDP